MINGVRQLKRTVQWLDSLKENEIALSEQIYNELSQPKKMKIHFGSCEIELQVMNNSQLNNKSIGLPYKFNSSYTIPTSIDYEYVIINDAIYIGPIIAYIVSGKFNKFTHKTLATYLPRMKVHKETGGLFFICTKDAIDIDNLKIKGYYYSFTDSNNGEWKLGEFPLPDAIYNRSFISRNTRLKLQKLLGNVIFNSTYVNLDKWRLWRNLSKRKSLKKHLPYTEKYTSTHQIFEFIEKFDAFYIKPRRKCRGIGIYYLSRTTDGFTVCDEKQQTTLLKDQQQIIDFFERSIIYPSIIQQPVPYKHKNRVIDFRVYLQKNEKKEWTFQGFTTRVSKEGSVVTNTVGRDYLLRGSEALATTFQLNKKTALKIEKEMIEVVQSAAQIYEDRGMHIADLAADIILDPHLNIWLLELQLTYATEKKVHEIPPEIFNKIMVTPFKYAKSLTRFNQHE